MTGMEEGQGKGKGKEVQRMEEDTESELDGSDAEHDPEDEEEEEEQEESELSELEWGDGFGEPAIIYNESPHTVWGRSYQEALRQDPDYGENAILREPFHRNEDGFILKSHSYHRPRVYIPKGQVRIGGELYCMRELLINAAHGRLGHFGTGKTYNDLRKETFWPGQWKQVQRFIQKCDTCQRTKLPTQKPPGIARMLQIPDHPWKSISIDFVGPLPVSGNMKHILVVVDRFSSAVRLIPMPDKYRARDICDALLKEIYARLGKPLEIVTDRGPQLVSNYFTEMQNAFQVELIPSTAFHQQTNGSAERAVKTVTQILRAYVNQNQNDWIHHLWRAEYAINNSSTEWSIRTPNEITFGPLVNPLKHTTSKSDAVNQYLKHMDQSNQVAHDELTATRVKQARYSQKRRNPEVTFTIGDMVMYRKRTWKKGLAHKLQPVWKGPYRIESIDKFGNCTLDLPGKSNRHPVFATDMLKLYHDDPDHQRDVSDITMDDAEDRLHEVDRIIDHRTKKGVYQYLIQWKGYDEDENTWEEAAKVGKTAPRSVSDFHKMIGTEPRHKHKRVSKRDRED
jgi:hypothetical protein